LHRVQLLDVEVAPEFGRQQPRGRLRRAGCGIRLWLGGRFEARNELSPASNFVRTTLKAHLVDVAVQVGVDQVGTGQECDVVSDEQLGMQVADSRRVLDDADAGRAPGGNRLGIGL
jgi:hypothetical protein